MVKCFTYSEKKIEQEARGGEPSSEHKYKPKWLPHSEETSPYMAVGVCKHTKNKELVAVWSGVEPGAICGRDSK